MAAQRIVVDASHDAEGVAGLGVGFLGGRHAIARSAALPAENNNQAEALAIALGLEYLARSRCGAGAEVLSDSDAVVRELNGWHSHLVEPSTAAVIRELADAHGYRIRCVSRRETIAAHRAARMARSAYRAGLAGSATWRLPTLLSSPFPRPRRG